MHKDYIKVLEAVRSKQNENQKSIVEENIKNIEQKRESI